MVLGQRDLLRVAVLLLALPLVSAIVVSRTRYRVASERRVEPLRVPAGQPARVKLRLENVSRLATGLLLLEDDVPVHPRIAATLRGRPGRAARRARDRLHRALRRPRRVHDRPADGAAVRPVRAVRDVAVVHEPRSLRRHAARPPPARRCPLGGEWSGSGDSRSKSIAAAGEDDIATREYRHGDDLRRVHWRSTARLGELMVRREEQPWQSRATVLLDTRKIAHLGDGPASSFEWAVSAAAASAAVHLFRRGYAVRLVTDTGAVVGGGAEGHLTVGDVEGMVLDALAVVSASRNDTLRQAAPALRRGGGDGLLVAVLGTLDAQELTSLTRLRQGTTTAIGILVDVGTWAARPTASRSASGISPRVAYDNSALLLRRSGWRVLTPGVSDSLSRAVAPGVLRRAGR